MPPFEQLSDDELLDLATQLEAQLESVRREFFELEQRVAVEGRRLRTAAIKLGLNGALGAGGLLAAPITMGWSLLLSAGSGAMTVWDVHDYLNDRSSYRELRQRTAALRTRSGTIADRYESASTAIKSRFGR
jgi:hypothetical protein